jgi:hypothetical protein
MRYARTPCGFVVALSLSEVAADARQEVIAPERAGQRIDEL